MYKKKEKKIDVLGISSFWREFILVNKKGYVWGMWEI